MNRLTKKAAASILCGTVALTACSCGNTTGTALTIDGEDIRAGIYIYYQSNALNDAVTALEEEQPELDMYAEDFVLEDQTVGGLDINEWVKNKTIEYCREYVAVNKLFDEYGLSLSDEELSEINTNTNTLWTEENMYAQYIYGVDAMGEYYESIGIGKESYKDISTAGYKRSAIFDHLYKEGGSLAVSADELSAKVVADYALVLSMEIDAEIASPETYLEMLNSGKTFSEVHQAYTKEDTIKRLEADIAKAEADGTEYTGTRPEELEVPLISEKDMQTIVSKDSTTPSESYVTDVFAMTAGEAKIITVSETITAADGTETTAMSYYLVKRLDIAADAEVMEEYGETALHSLKDEEFDTTMKTAGSAYSVSENAAAIKKYTIEKLDQ
ncbi:MAG: hypothetical protein IJX15_08925 [Ruminiclostridium sp.]|nr:hypothetical protein [Ruminiclostridium sp.]